MRSIPENYTQRVFDFIEPPAKQCDTCLKVKPLLDFGRNRQNGDQKQKSCKVCIKRSCHKKAIAGPDQTKQCTTCHETKPITAFYSDGGANSRFGVRSNCKVCGSAYQKAHRPKPILNRKRYPHQERVHKLQANYNLTVTQYDEMLASQNGVCVLCDRPERVRDKRLNGNVKHLGVDHSHSTGKIRALLCQDCNLVIGKIEDNPKILERAADYLARYK